MEFNVSMALTIFWSLAYTRQGQAPQSPGLFLSLVALPLNIVTFFEGEWNNKNLCA